MARSSVVNRNIKREKLVQKYAAKRAELKEIIRNPKTSDDDRWQAQQKLQALPRDSSKVRVRNRCALTGRPRGVYSRFGLGRNKLRELAVVGDIPGLIKASW